MRKLTRFFSFRLTFLALLIRHLGLVSLPQLPEGLELIEGNAFYMCNQLERINLPSTLEAIDPYAFMGANKLTELVMPASVRYLGQQAFGYLPEIEKKLS